jgi:hypothetical protein
VRHRMRVELGRVKVPALHGADGARDVAVTGIHKALQGRSHVEQEGVAACPRQRPGRSEDGIELGVTQSKWLRHAADSAAGFRLSAEYDFGQRGGGAFPPAAFDGVGRIPGAPNS